MKRELKVSAPRRSSVASRAGNSSIPYEEGTERGLKETDKCPTLWGNSSIPYEEGTESDEPHIGFRGHHG